MIAFPCKQCGKRFDRPESTAGSVVFCECGAYNQVPWEATLPPLGQPTSSEPPTPARPPTSRWQEAVPPPPPVPSWERSDPYAEPRSLAAQSVDPAYCFVHTAAPTVHTCTDCGLPFCGDCCVMLKAKPFCGPCKNYVVRVLQRPPQLAAMALLAPLLSIVVGGIWMFVMLIAITISSAGGGNGTGVVITAMMGLVPQAAAALMAGSALRRIEDDPDVSGRALAITGLVAALVCSVLVFEMMLLGLRASR